MTRFTIGTRLFGFVWRAITMLLLGIVCLQMSAFGADKWTSVRSQHFYLIGNGSVGQIRETAKNLEQFREAMARVFPQLSQPASNETTVIVFNSDRAFEPYKPQINGKPEKIAGYFLQGHDLNYMAISSEFGVRPVYGTYAFAVTRDVLRNLPRGLQMGIANFFQTFELVDKDTFHLGQPAAVDLRYINEHPLMLVKDLLELPSDSPVWERDPQRVHASSWAFVHFMMMSREGRPAEQFGAFLKFLNSGTPVEKAFQDAFEATYNQMDKELAAYAHLESLAYRKYHVSDPIEIDKQMEVHPLTEAEALAYLGDYLWRSGRVGEAETTLKKALALNSKLSLAYASQGMIAMQRKNYAEAENNFKQAIDSGTASYLVYYLRANSMRRQAAEQKVKPDDEALRLMKTSLELAIQLKPDFAESYVLLADVNGLRGKDFDQTVDTLKKAITIFPTRSDLQLYEAEALFRLLRFAEALALAQPISSNASVDPAIRSRAQNVVKAAQTQLQRPPRP